MTAERRAFAQALRLTGILLGALAVALGAVGWFVGGPDSAGAAVAGVAVAAFVGMSTQAAAYVGTKLSPAGFASVFLGSFALKAVVLLAVLWAVKGSDMNRGAFIVPLVVGAIATLLIDLVVLGRARVPNVTPGRREEPG